MSGGGGGSYNPVQGRLDTSYTSEIDRRNKVATQQGAASTQSVLTPGRKATLMGGLDTGSGEQAALIRALTTNPVTEEYKAAAAAKEKQDAENQKRLMSSIALSASNAGRR